VEVIKEAYNENINNIKRTKTMEKYLVASSGDTLDSKVSGRYGHSLYFLIIDPQTMEFKVFPGIDKDEYMQGVRKFVNLGIKKVITGNIGPSAYNDVISSGCTVYICRNMPVCAAVIKVKNGDVPVLKEPTLKESIHSARKAGSGYGGRGEGRGKGRGQGTGLRDGKGMGRGQGIGRGRGMGAGRGRGGNR
jgi:predicted Fe-Mo cluster-binding NifX family protein